MRSKGLVLSASAVCTTFAACVIVSSSSPAIDFSPALRGYAASGLASYETLATDTAELDTAAAALCAEPSAAALDDTRARWREALVSFRATAAFGLGPAMRDALAADLAFFPTRPSSIEANLASGEPISDAWVAELGAAGTGLFAIEHLVFPQPGAADDTLDGLVADPRRCEYAAALAHHAAEVANATRLAWSSEGEGFADDFASGVGGNSVLMSALATQMVTALQLLKLTQLGKPLGLSDGGTPQPGDVEARLARHSVAAMRATLASVAAAWGTGSDSLAALVRARRPDLATRFDDALAAADAALVLIEEPFDEQLSGGAELDAVAAHTAARAVERILASEIASPLGVMVSLTDSDGD